jgi:hypothetical protein
VTGSYAPRVYPGVKLAKVHLWLVACDIYQARRHFPESIGHPQIRSERTSINKIPVTLSAKSCPQAHKISAVLSKFASGLAPILWI